MRQVTPHALWLGHVGDARKLSQLFDAGIAAIVDLALNEPAFAAPRELVYCRFPIMDGVGNPPWLLKAAVTTLAELLGSNTPTLVFCSHGMSRSPAIAAAAIHVVSGLPLPDCIAVVAKNGALDVSTGLWNELAAAIR